MWKPGCKFLSRDDEVVFRTERFLDLLLFDPQQRATSPSGISSFS